MDQLLRGGGKRGLGLPRRILGERMRAMKPISSFMPLKRPSVLNMLLPHRNWHRRWPAAGCDRGRASASCCRTVILADIARRCRPAASVRTRRRSRRASRRIVRQREVRRQQHDARRRRSVSLPCEPARTAGMRARAASGRAIQPAQHSPSSTPSVALWVAAANAVNAEQQTFLESTKSCSPCRTRMKQRQHRQPGEDVGQQHAGEPRQRGGQRSAPG